MTDIKLTDEMLAKGVQLMKSMQEDDKTGLTIVRELLENVLTGAGFNVTSAPTMTTQEAVARLASLTASARELLAEAEQLAILHDLSFSFDVTYGAGATFNDGQWYASSQQC